MLMSFAAGSPSFMEGTRWLDLFAGTGSVGLEALSRGAAHCHFIELDSWVINNVLSPNIESCSMSDSTVIHSGKAEAFLQRARDAPQFASKPFDYIRCSTLAALYSSHLVQRPAFQYEPVCLQHAYFFGVSQLVVYCLQCLPAVSAGVL
jgi:predicted methyltransferase